MKWKIEKKYFKLAAWVLAVIICAMLFQYFLNDREGETKILTTINNAFVPIVGGLVFAYLLNPILNFFEHYIFSPLANVIWKKDSKAKIKMKFSRALGIICTLILFFIIVIGGLYLVVPQVYFSLVKMVSDAPGYYDSIVNWINSLDSDKSDVSKYILLGLDRGYAQALDYLNSNIIPNIDKIVVSVTSGIVVGLKMLLNAVLMLIISVYVMAEKELLISVFKKLTYSIFSTRHANEILKGIRYVDKVFGGFVNGKIIDSFIIGAICYFVMTIAGMDYAVLISIIIGFTNIIPYFGPFIGAIPSTLILLILDWKEGLFFVIFILILQQLDGNVIGPLILGDRLNLSSMWILFSITVGGGFFGVPGMILGAPCFACLYALVGTICKDLLQKKNLPTDAEAYYDVGSIEEDGTIIERQHYIQEGNGDILKKKREKKRNRYLRGMKEMAATKNEKDEDA